MRVSFSSEVEQYRTESPDQDYLDGVPYSYRGATEGRVTNVTAAESKDDLNRGYGPLVKELPVQLGSTVYAVVVTYTTGDTFGSEGGQVFIADAFTDPDTAARLCEFLQAQDGRDFNARWGENNTDYHIPWAGYFEHLNDISVWAVTVRGRHGYKRFGSNETVAFKWGR